MTWECKHHGESCGSYAKGIADEWNEKGFTPENLPEREKTFLKVVHWVKKRTPPGSVKSKTPCR